MNVEGILRTKGAHVVTIRPDATIEELVGGLRNERIGAMVVSKDGQSVLGIISERDVVRGLAERGSRILDEPVADLMTRDVVACGLGDTVKQVMAEMTRRTGAPYPRGRGRNVARDRQHRRRRQEPPRGDGDGDERPARGLHRAQVSRFACPVHGHSAIVTYAARLACGGNGAPKYSVVR